MSPSQQARPAAPDLNIPPAPVAPVPSAPVDSPLVSAGFLRMTQLIKEGLNAPAPAVTPDTAKELIADMRSAFLHATSCPTDTPEGQAQWQRFNDELRSSALRVAESPAALKGLSPNLKKYVELVKSGAEIEALPADQRATRFEKLDAKLDLLVQDPAFMTELKKFLPNLADPNQTGADVVAQLTPPTFWERMGSAFSTAWSYAVPVLQFGAVVGIGFMNGVNGRTDNYGRIFAPMKDRDPQMDELIRTVANSVRVGQE